MFQDGKLPCLLPTMEFSLVKVVTPWVLPPGVLFVGILAGLAARSRARKLGNA